MSAGRLHSLSIIVLGIAVIVLAMIRQSEQCISDPVPRVFVDKPCGADVTWRYGYWAMRDESGPKMTVRYALGLWCGDHAQVPVGDHP